MNDLLPTIDELGAAADDRGRAVWLLQCPDVLIVGHGRKIRAMLETAEFGAGCEFVDIRVACVNAVRDQATAGLPAELAALRDEANDIMVAIAARGSLRDRHARSVDPTAL